MLTFKDAAERYIEWGRYGGGKGGRPWATAHAQTVEMRLAWWQNQLFRIQVDVEICEVTPDVVDRVAPKIPGKQGKPPTTKTRREYIGCLKAFLNWCVKRGHLERNPIDCIDLPSAQSSKDYRALTVDEYRRLIAVAPSVVGCDRRMFYKMSAITGLRRGEILSLKVRDFDFDNHRLHLQADVTKNRKGGVIVLPKALSEDLLKSTLVLHSDSPLCVLPNIHKDFHIDRQIAGIPYQTAAGYATLTSLRDLRATLLQANGASPAEAQKLMRHASIETTQRHYTSVEDEKLAEHVQGLEDALSGPETPVMGKPAEGVAADDATCLVALVREWSALTLTQKMRIMRIVQED